MENILYLTNADAALSDAVVGLMKDNGYETTVWATLDDWAAAMDEHKFSLVLIGQEHPLDYLQTCRLIREKSNVPILILSDRSDSVDTVLALEMGADDYLPIPFERLTLMARIRALLRRANLGGDGDPPERTVSENNVIVIGHMKVDCNFRDAFVGDAPVGLTNIEFKLLYHFLQNQDVLISSGEIFAAIWGYDIANNSHSLTTYIHQLKRKLRFHGVTLPLESSKGVGYKMNPATEVTLFQAPELLDAKRGA